MRIKSALLVCLSCWMISTWLFTASQCAAQPVTVTDCDFNDDGNCDVQDMDALMTEIVGGLNSPAFDLTGDGIVDPSDRDAWLAEAGAANLPSGNPYQVADFNLDATVDVKDLNIWNANKFTSATAWSAGEANGFAGIDGSDFQLWNNNKFMLADSFSVSGAATSGNGVPGDGVPDVYFFSAAGTAPNGEFRSAGSLLLDTDGADFFSLMVSSAADFTSIGTCTLCDGDFIAMSMQFTSGFVNDSSQWARVNPLTGAGPSGIVDLAQLVGATEGDPSFIGQFGGSSVVFTSDLSQEFLFDVTVVPEPHGTLLVFGWIAYFMSLRRNGE